MRNIGLLTDGDHLDDVFRASLARGFALDHEYPFLKHSLTSEDQIDNAAFEKWSSVLNFLVVGSEAKSNTSSRKGEARAFKMPSVQVQDLLKHMGLVHGSSNEITGKGYGFTLKDVYTQVRLVVQCYVRLCMPPDDMLSLLFKLSFSPRGVYMQRPKTVSPTDLILLQELGLIIGHDPACDVFAVSLIGVNALFGTAMSLNVDLQPKHGLQNMQIIVETTFKLYCYTTSSLHEKMLRHFVSVEAMLPNLIVGSLTRDSVTGAMSKGITANQIVDFLCQNAHPLCKTRVHIVPDNVSDQINLWERDCKRITCTDGFYLHSFRNQEVFLQVQNFAKDQGVFVWSDPKTTKLFVKKEGGDEVRAFIVDLKARLSN